MAITPDARNVARTVATAKVPSRRERVASQFGQIDDLVSGDWNATDGTPETIKEALNRLAAAITDLLAKLDADAGVGDTNYAATLKP